MMRQNSNKIGNKLHPLKGSLYLEIEAAIVKILQIGETMGKHEPIYQVQRIL